MVERLGAPDPRAAGTAGEFVPAAPPPGGGPAADEAALLESLRRGDEAVFERLVTRYHGSMVRIAMGFVRRRDVAEEVVQEAWLGMLRGLDRFEARSSLKTWLFQILVNRARTRGEREARMVPLSDDAATEIEADEPSVNPDRFRGPADQLSGHWFTDPAGWGQDPERRLMAAETRGFIQKTIDGLPKVQRMVMTLRDLEGWTSEEVCNVLGLSETNQRVLLHRARTRVRRALELRFERGWGSDGD